MVRKRFVATLVLVPVLGMLLASCGSSEARLSSGDFKSQFAALCKTRDAKTDKLLNGNFFSMENGAKVWPKAKVAIDDYVDGVKDLNPPKADEDWYDDYVDQADKVLGQVDDASRTAKAGDQKSYSKALGALFETFATIDKPTADHGIKKCYNPEDNPPASEKPASGATVVTIGAKEYAFDIPTDIKAGKTAFKLVDRGNELHVFFISKLKDGATFDQVRDAVNNDKDPSEFTDDRGGTGIAAPDGSSFGNVDLDAGTYVAFCFIGAPDGTEHYKKGMLAPFTVS